MKRRALLATTGTLLSGALAGCESADSTATRSARTVETTSTPTTAPTEITVTSSEDAPVSIEEIAVRKAVVRSYGLGSSDILHESGRQCVLATVRVERTVPAPALTFEAGGQSWEPREASARVVAGRAHTRFVSGDDLDVDRAPYLLVFDVPSPLSASDPRIKFQGSTVVERSLGVDQRAKLASPAPEFELESFEVPDVVTQGETVSVSLTISNVSEQDGRCLAALYWPTLTYDDDEAHIVRESTAAGETFTESFTFEDVFMTQEPSTVSVRVNGQVEGSHPVEVQFPETDTPTAG